MHSLLYLSFSLYFWSRPSHRWKASRNATSEQESNGSIRRWQQWCLGRSHQSSNEPQSGWQLLLLLAGNPAADLLDVLLVFPLDPVPPGAAAALLLEGGAAAADDDDDDVLLSRCGSSATDDDDDLQLQQALDGDTLYTISAGNRKDYIQQKY